MSHNPNVCPVCDAAVSIAANTEVSEILTCAECGSSLVVEDMHDQHVHLALAPAIEEDWGQ